MNDLPENEFLYISSRTPLINVDMMVLNEDGKVLFSWRDDEFCGTGWHIPGGIIRHGETMKERLHITAERELGIVPAFEDAPCKISEIFLDQQYRNHFISHLFRGRCMRADVETVDVAERPGELKWFDHYPGEGIVYSQPSYVQYLKEYFETLERNT